MTQDITADSATVETDQPAAPTRARKSVAEKVLTRAVELAANPMPLEKDSRFAPARRIEAGLFLSGDGSLLIARQGDDWRVSEYQVSDGQVQVIGEPTVYPSAQRALAAIRDQMTAGS